MNADRSSAHRDTAPFGNKPDVSLAAALREHTGRMARAEAMRYQIVMGLLGFIGGLIVVVPLVLWAAPQRQSIFSGAAAGGAPAISNRITVAERANEPSLINVPAMAVREAKQGSIAHDEPVERARNLIRSGDILAARRVLGAPGLRQSGPALFMLAETYDPNVLAALGATSVDADTPTAKRYYEAALSVGVASAAARLEALE